MTHKFDALPDGFYWLGCPTEARDCLVKLYTMTDDEDEDVRGIGFGQWDGGGFVPLADLADDAILTPVQIHARLEDVKAALDDAERGGKDEH